MGLRRIRDSERLLDERAGYTNSLALSALDPMNCLQRVTITS